MSKAPLSSRQNARFKYWRSLLESKSQKKEGRCLVSGPKILRELITQQPDRVEEWILTPDMTPFDHPAKAVTVSKSLFQELDVIGTHAPLAVVRIEPMKPWSPRPPQGLELVLALSDPGNLGALLRSAEAFGVNRVIFCEEACSPYLPRAIRAASGSTFRLPFERAGRLATFNGSPAYGLDMNGTDLTQFDWPKDSYLVIGEEGQGLPSEINLKERLRLPMKPTVESLNATVAASLALFMRFQKTR